MTTDWSIFYPPNIPLLYAKLDDDIVEHLWECIEEARKTDISANDRLAGNITSSLEMKDKNNVFMEHVRGSVTKYLEEFLKTYAGRGVVFEEEKDYECDICLSSLWVNFQKKHEFNPVHEHSGAASFVVWMKIPTYAKEQHNLPISKRSNNSLASDFVFYYQNLVGGICEHKIELNPESNGNILVFPSTLQHCVYPFFECDEERISISGNLMYRRLKSSE